MLTQQIAKELFDYKDGLLIRKKRVSNKDKAGVIAGCYDKSEGYRRVTVNGKAYKEHQIIWLLFNGELPKQEIDHIDHDRSNNRIENLRQVSRKDNRKNLSLFANNTSGFNGVNYHKRDKKWVASIRVNKALIHIGSYNEIEEAISARLFANSYYGFFDNHGKEKNG